MSSEEFATLSIGDFVVEGKNHLIEVDSLTSNSVVYWENGYWHEVNREYLTKVKTSK